MTRYTFTVILAVVVTSIAGSALHGQINSGSDGHDGALNPTSNLVIDMADHPDGVYQYTSVNIPSGVTVSFIPNAANTPVVWLVQDSCTISGIVDVSGQAPGRLLGGLGGPGGYRGGSGPLTGGVSVLDPGAGLGPGGGAVTAGHPEWIGGNASFGTLGLNNGPNSVGRQHPSGDMYGNPGLLPLVGGSGGSGGTDGLQSVIRRSGGGGGGGAILIASSSTITLTGSIRSNGGSPSPCQADPTPSGGGAGSGGAVRLVATTLSGSGSVEAQGGAARWFWAGSCYSTAAGNGRIRLEASSNSFNGSTTGGLSIGFPTIILLPANAPRLFIKNVGGVPVDSGANSANPPDVIVPGQQTNPISIVVNCQNIPLNSDIIVEVRPLSGAIVTATGQNATGTMASSTATISMNLPSGEGYISARTTTNLMLSSAQNPRRLNKGPSLFETGLAANGERFKAVELKSMLGGSQELVYVTTSGKRFPMIGGKASRRASPTTRPRS